MALASSPQHNPTLPLSYSHGADGLSLARCEALATCRACWSLPLTEAKQRHQTDGGRRGDYRGVDGGPYTPLSNCPRAQPYYTRCWVLIWALGVAFVGSALGSMRLSQNPCFSARASASASPHWGTGGFCALVNGGVSRRRVGWRGLAYSQRRGLTGRWCHAIVS